MLRVLLRKLPSRPRVRCAAENAASHAQSRASQGVPTKARGLVRRTAGRANSKAATQSVTAKMQKARWLPEGHGGSLRQGLGAMAAQAGPIRSRSTDWDAGSRGQR